MLSFFFSFWAFILKSGNHLFDSSVPIFPFSSNLLSLNLLKQLDKGEPVMGEKILARQGTVFLMRKAICLRNADINPHAKDGQKMLT